MSDIVDTWVAPPKKIDVLVEANYVIGKNLKALNHALVVERSPAITDNVPLYKALSQLTQIVEAQQQLISALIEER